MESKTICIRAEAFEHMLLGISIRWQIQNVIEFLSAIKTGTHFLDCRLPPGWKHGGDGHAHIVPHADAYNIVPLALTS